MVCSSLVIFLEGRLIDLDTLCFNDSSDLHVNQPKIADGPHRLANPLFEASQVGRAQGVGFGNNGNQVHSGAQTFHDLDIKGFQGVASRTNEVETGMDSQINLVNSPGLLLLQHVGLMLVIQELNDGHPGISIVDVVTKSRRVDHRQAH